MAADPIDNEGHQLLFVFFVVVVVDRCDESYVELTALKLGS